VAVVGTGFGCRVHVPALRAAGFEVVALVGRDAERTARRAVRCGVERACASLAEALALGLDAVTIATPPATHAPLALEAVAAGCHVLCEKPFVLDENEARRVRDATADAGVVGLIGHEFRYAVERMAAGAAIAGGSIGEPRLATFVHASDLVADPATPRPRWWFDATAPAAGGDWLGASGSHAIDQIRWWLGEFESVSAACSPREFTVRFSMRTGVEGILQQTAESWGPPVNVTRVSGTAGTVWLDGGQAWLAGAGREARALCDAPPPPPPVEDPRHRFTLLELGPYTALAERFAALIAGAPLPPGPRPATFDDGVANTLVLDAIRRSSAGGGTVQPPG